MPEEVKAAIQQMKNVNDVAVKSTPARSEIEGELEVLAYVGEAKRGKTTAEEVLIWIKERSSAHKAPTGGVLFCESRPRSTYGKMVRSELGNVRGFDGSRRFLTL
jgi:acyl-coenzyme A synthetase/AMP-(fatty) acid ligase